MVNKIILIISLILLFSCSGIREPIIKDELELIPPKLALNYLNSNNEDYRCNFYKDYLEGSKILGGKIKYNYEDININEFGVGNTYAIEIRNSLNLSVICSSIFNNKVDLKKYVEAFVSMGGNYNKGLF